MDRNCANSQTTHNYNEGKSLYDPCMSTTNNDKMELVGMLSQNGEILKYGSRKYIKRGL